MREKVTYVKLHDANAMIPGVGNMSDTLPNPSKAWKIEMYYTPGDSVIEVLVNGKHARIPITNVKVFVVAPPEPKVAAVVVK